MNETANPVNPANPDRAIGEVTAGQLAQLKERTVAYDLLTAKRNAQESDLVATKRLLAIVQNEVSLYINAILKSNPATDDDHTYRVDPETGGIYEVASKAKQDDEDRRAELDALAAEAKARDVLAGNPTIEQAATAELPEPHEYVPNRAPLNSDAQRCIFVVDEATGRKCDLNFDEIPGIHTDESQPQPAP